MIIFISFLSRKDTLKTSPCEQILPKLLHYKVSLQYCFFYDIGDNWVLKSNYHIDYIHKVSFQNVFFYDSGDHWDLQRIYYIDYIQKVSLQYVSFYVLGD